MGGSRISIPIFLVQKNVIFFITTEIITTFSQIMILEKKRFTFCNCVAPKQWIGDKLPPTKPKKSRLDQSHSFLIPHNYNHLSPNTK